MKAAFLLLPFVSGSRDDPPQWKFVAPMNEARSNPAVAAVGGAIFACGGTNNAGGPDHRATHLKSCERYDPAKDTWTEIAPMSVPRVGGRAAALDGRLWVAGGMIDGLADITGTMEVYDPASNKWSNSTSYPASKSGVSGLLFHSMVATNGQLVVVGLTKDPDQPNIATFNVTSQAWTGWAASANTSTQLRLDMAAAALETGEVVALGGSSEMAGRMTIYDQANIRDIGAGEATPWKALPPMSTPRAYAAAAAHGGNDRRIFALGGQEVGLAKFKLNTAEVLTLPTGGGAPSWAAMPNMLVRRSGHGAVVIGDTLYAVGGIGGPYNSALPAVEALSV